MESAIEILLAMLKPETSADDALKITQAILNLKNATR
jgi:hypothetical protein